MILIADSGGTKTDWRLIDENQNITQFVTGGLNPFQTEPETINREIQEVLKPQIEAEIEKVFFYGAGCSTEKNIDTISGSLSSVFTSAVIEVNHDMLAAARSLCNHDPGIACILGTGANSCLFDGEQIIENIPSLAYVLGDEGSGSYLGKTLLAAYFRKELSPEINDRIQKRFKLNKSDVLENIYHKEKVGNYLAGFSRFIFQNIKDPILYKMAYDGFELFFEKNVMKYENHKDYTIHFTGSIAYYFADILRQAANDMGLAIKNIVESPIAGLTLYHLNNENA